MKNLELAAFISVHTIEAVIQAALNDRQDILNSDYLEDELTNLMVRYLVK